MPAWAGKWKGGRYYLDDAGKPVFFIERRVAGKVRPIKLKTHDQDLALGELARFLDDPVAYVRPAPEPEAAAAPVHITKERVSLYLAELRRAVKDHKSARRSHLHGWATYLDERGRAIDLRTVDRNTLRTALASFEGGHAGRVESLNAFARFLVREGEIERWVPLRNTWKPKETRAERVAYGVEQLSDVYVRLCAGAERAKTDPRAAGVTSPAVRDCFMLRAATGMHHTEIEQLRGCRVYDGPLPDKGVGIRVLGAKGEIAGVIQFKQKTKPRHRISVSAEVLAAALRLRDGVPSRITMYYALEQYQLVPSNLRHTWITLSQELGEVVYFKTRGVSLDVVQQTAGHRVGSKVTLSNYDKTQIPPMIRLPFNWARTS